MGQKNRDGGTCIVLKGYTAYVNGFGISEKVMGWGFSGEVLVFLD